MTNSILINVLLTIMLIGILSCKKDDDVIKDFDFDPEKYGDYFVAINGNDDNPGTYKLPWASWQKAFDVAEAGDTVYFGGGVYKPKVASHINNITMIAPKEERPIGNDGKPGNPICFFNYPGETPVLDCSSIYPSGNYNTALNILKADFIHFKGLEIKNVYQFRGGVQAFGIGSAGCSNLKFENISVHHISGNAYRYLGAVGYFGIEYDSTYFINCDAYNCADTLSSTPFNYADGFKLDNEINSYFYFEGCRAYNCSDDGLDISGSSIAIIYNCWSFSNGVEGSPDGNGYKLGGLRDSISEPAKFIINSISAFNTGFGYHELDYTGYYRNNGRFYNNLFYANNYGPFSFENADRKFRNSVYRNNISYKDTLGVGFYYGIPGIEDHNTWDYSESYPNWVNTDSVSVSNLDFLSLNIEQLKAKRNPDGSLPDVAFGHLADDSDLKGAGVYVGMSETPDIGIDWAWLERKK